MYVVLVANGRPMLVSRLIGETERERQGMTAVEKRQRYQLSLR